MQIMHFTFPNTLWRKMRMKVRCVFEEYQILKKKNYVNLTKHSDQNY